MDSNSFSNQTEDWKKWEKGRNYNNSLKPSYYTTTDTNIAFTGGDQWRNLESYDMPKPTFNIIKRAISFFVATITSNKVKIQYEPLPMLSQEELGTEQPGQNEHEHASDVANAEVENLFEKFAMENRIRDALFDAAITGDAAAHLYFDKTAQQYGGTVKDATGQPIEGEICFELVDGTNVMLGNANNPKIDTKVQPYVIVSGRDMVDNLKDEAKQYKTQQADIDSISSDKMYDGQAGDAGKIEIISDDYGKALYIIIYKYDKKTETIHVSKCTENVYIYKDIDTGLTNYPVAWMNWEKQKNQYHGRAVCTGLIPNQIFINKMFAMVMYHLMMSAFPKAIYDKDKIDGWNNAIGAAIPVKDLNGENIRNLAGYIDAGNMSAQIVEVIDLAIKETKDAMGINDAFLGTQRAVNYRAIVALQKAAEAPLENIKANLYEWIEEIGKILLDMMGTYYGTRPVVLNSNGQKVLEQFDFAQLKDLWLNVKSDVGATSYYSEIASIETLDNLLKEGAIDVISYLEAVPDGYIMHRDDLIENIKAQMAQKAQMQGQQPPQQANPAQFEQMAQFIQSLPPDTQAQLEQLRQANPQQYEQTVLQLMQGGAQNGQPTQQPSQQPARIFATNHMSSVR